MLRAGESFFAAYGPGRWETGSWVARAPHCPLTASRVLGESRDEEPTCDVPIQHAGSTLHAPPLPAHMPSTPAPFWCSGDRARQTGQTGIRHAAPRTPSVGGSSARPDRQHSHLSERTFFRFHLPASPCHTSATPLLYSAVSPLFHFLTGAEISEEIENKRNT